MMSSSRSAALGIDEIGQRLGGVADDVELAMERAAALVQLVFVLEPGIKALEIRAVPENVGLFLDRDAAGHPLPDQQRVADKLEDLSPARRAAALVGKVAREGSTMSKTALTCLFVVGEGHAFRRARRPPPRSRAGDEVLDEDRAARAGSGRPSPAEFDDGGLFLVRANSPATRWRKLADHVVFLEGREADQNGDAIAEQGHKAVLADPEGEGRGGNHVAALEPRHVDAIAEQESAGGDAGSARGEPGWRQSGLTYRTCANLSEKGAMVEAQPLISQMRAPLDRMKRDRLGSAQLLNREPQLCASLFS